MLNMLKTLWNISKTKLILFGLLFLTLLVLYYLGNVNIVFGSVSKNLKLVTQFNFNLIRRPKNDTKYILYWIPFFDTKDYGIGVGSRPFKNCDYKNCYATWDNQFMQLEDFDLLIFHGVHKKNKTKQPKVRKSNQIYVYMNLESPFHTTPNLKLFASFYNWTMSYRFDSDVVMRNGIITAKKTGYVNRGEKLVNKTKLAAWFVSNCKTPSKREILVKEIRKYIPVDIYGSCGKLKCPHRSNHSNLSSEKCYDMVEKNYKFYFSFENSYCKDYSTEKLYNILRRNIVPVVYGAGDYSLSAPPHSVINVEDYKNVSDLVNYLKYLDKNDDKYLEYFEWKKHFYIATSVQYTACQICNKLNEPSKEKVYDDLFTWLWGQNKSICKSEKLLPIIVSQLLPN